DPFVVEGFLSTATTSQVEVHLMRGAVRCYQGQTNVTHIWHRHNDWDVTVLEVVRSEAEAVIVIAGRKGVVQSGVAGWMLGRPTIPFGGFGGGAQKVWDYGSSDRPRVYFGGLRDIENDQLNNPWQPHAAGSRIVKLPERCSAPTRRGGGSPRMRVGLSTGILVALMAWVLFLALPLLGWPGSAPAASSSGPSILEASTGVRFLQLLAAVCSAGAFGALVQSMRGIRDGIAVT